MDADPALSERIEGLTPNYTEHHSFFHIQPVREQTQLNFNEFLINNFPHFRLPVYRSSAP